MESGTLRTRLTILLGIVSCVVVFRFVSGAFHIPSSVGFDTSLLRQPNVVVSVLLAGVAFVACAALVTFALGRGNGEVGLFCAAAGLAVLSARGGTITATLQYAAGGSVFITLAIELVLLYAFVAAGVYASRMLSDEPTASTTPGHNDEPPTLNHNLLAVAVQTVVMTVLMLLLAQSEAKKQAMVAVGVSACLGAIASHYTFRVQRGQWLVVAPLIVGVIGYLVEFSKPSLLPIGLVDQPLATPLPIDYASFGIMGGILGHWMSRKWQAEAEAMAVGRTA